MSNIIYQCFSYAQKEFLINQGHNVLCSGLHCENHKKFWVFYKSNKLKTDLVTWSNNNPKK
jgi:hypothetical protein